MTDEYANQPSIEDWRFIEQLKSPLHTPIVWRRTRKGRNEVDLRRGVSLAIQFPDPKGLLDTACDDFNRFLAAGGIPVTDAYKIITSLTNTDCAEEYLIEAREDSCLLLAGDTEGIRRALVALEDRITSAGGPFLPYGKIHRKPFIRTRISRCFFGPIKRPPLNRDELLDDVNYYPDEYLNRLAHEGVNALWLSISFKDLCPSRFFPEHGQDAPKRLEKLRKTVQQCARFGIKIYVFCNEPLGFSDLYGFCQPLSSLERNPQFAGQRTGDLTYFCTSSPEALEYVEECTHHIFANVPDLGGMININMGEFPTNCYSYMAEQVNCPRCSQRAPWEVYHDLLSAFAHGMKRAAPEAEYISWLYTPALSGPPLCGEASALNMSFGSEARKKEILRKIAAHAPNDVTVQLNFESNGRVKQLGKERIAYDYWPAWPGPSDIFADVATNTVNAGARAAAKIQVGCSHEDATVPFLPVPGSLYRKYRAMRDLGVSSVMQCWYFGNYPGIMNKAAGELSFLPFEESEHAFLERLAKIDWAGNHRKVARAWKQFMRGYSNCPIALPFAWIGPLHCSIVWPMYLLPVDRPIAPSWTFGAPDSADRIGQCIGFSHSLDEVLTLLGRMDEHWQKGLEIFSSIEQDYAGNPDRQLDIALSRAIGLQIRSARNVFTFYDMRERLPFVPQDAQRAALKRMEGIVREEIENAKTMKELCLRDSRLGFHSEAEGYKFFPVKLDWRVGLLQQLLDEDFPKVRASIEQHEPLFPEYTGVSIQGKSYRYSHNPDTAEVATFEDSDGSWKAWSDGKAFHFTVEWTPRESGSMIRINIEPRRLWPTVLFHLSQEGKMIFTQGETWEGNSTMIGERCVSTVSIPFTSIPGFKRGKPLRINVSQMDASHQYLSGWIPWHPLPTGLLIFGNYNSADLGWFLPARR